MENIEKFLIEAKKQTYANKNIKRIKSSRLKSEDYEYKKDNMIYHDTYFGSYKFIGEEIVYIDNDIYWAMNYYGMTYYPALTEEVINKVLKPALMKVGEDDILPLRGPKEFKIDGYKYTFSVNGDLDNFNGIECIYKGNKKIYELKCNGGLIK